MPVLDQLITQAFRIAGVLEAPGRSFGANTSATNEGFSILNTLLDEWATQRLLVYRVQRFVGNVNVNQQSYQIGMAPGADYQTPRPVRIEFAGLIQNNLDTSVPAELPLAILTPLDWASIAVKNITGSTPQKLYYEPTLPNGTIWLWPIPQVANQIALMLWQQLGSFTTVNDAVELPQGYLKALQYNLALEIAARPWHPPVIPMSPMAIDIAHKSKAWVKAMNRPTMDLEMRTESGAQGHDNHGRWDITTNQYRFN